MSGRSRVPNPPAMTTAATASSSSVMRSRRRSRPTTRPSCGSTTGSWLTSASFIRRSASTADTSGGATTGVRTRDRCAGSVEGDPAQHRPPDVAVRQDAERGGRLPRRGGGRRSPASSRRRIASEIVSRGEMSVRFRRSARSSAVTCASIGAADASSSVRSASSAPAMAPQGACRSASAAGPRTRPSFFGFPSRAASSLPSSRERLARALARRPAPASRGSSATTGPRRRARR